jgi:hypothetical protein
MKAPRVKRDVRRDRWRAWAIQFNPERTPFGLLFIVSQQQPATDAFRVLVLRESATRPRRSRKVRP